jgi:DNA-binding transcriptional MerR regulator
VEERTYIRKEVEQITGIPARRVQFYTESGLLMLDEQEPGKGIGRKYEETHILQLLIIKVLAKSGISLSRIKEIMSFKPGKGLKEKMFNPKTYLKDGDLDFWIAIFDGDSVQYGEGDYGLDMEGHSSVMVVNVRFVAEELVEKLFRHVVS